MSKTLRKLGRLINIRNMWPGLVLAVVSLRKCFMSISKHFIVHHFTVTSTLKENRQFIYKWKRFHKTGNLPRLGSSQELTERYCRKSPRIQRWLQRIYSAVLAQSVRVQESSILKRLHYFALYVTYTRKMNVRPSVTKRSLSCKWTWNMILCSVRSEQKFNEKRDLTVRDWQITKKTQ